MISSISSFNLTPIVSGSNPTKPPAITARIAKIIITLSEFLFKKPKKIGLTVDAAVPIADINPEPIARALEGYS